MLSQVWVTKACCFVRLSLCVKCSHNFKMSKADKKLTVLRQIRDAKDVLFGAFSDSLTKQNKVVEWKKILQSCKAFGLVNADKDYTYVRDTFWSNIKRATLAKKDNANRTGTAGGKDKKLLPIDELVLEILGKDSPIIEGVGAGDYLSPQQSVPFEDIPATSSDPQNTTVPVLSNDSDVVTNEKSIEVGAKRKDTKYVTKGSKAHAECEMETTLKRRKLELQVEFLELENYKLKLETLDLERKLQVEPSKYTEEIARLAANNALYITDDNLISLSNLQNNYD